MVIFGAILIAVLLGLGFVRLLMEIDFDAMQRSEDAANDLI